MSKQKDIVWFGMKLTPNEKQKIKELAKYKGVSQKEAVMNLVEEGIVEYSEKKAGTKYFQKIKKYAGSVEGPVDLASNPKHMENYGK